MSKLNNNTAQLEILLQKVNALPDASNGIELPTLANKGSAEDLLTGKELIDGDGNVVTGTFTIDDELTTQETLLSDQDAKLAELAEILSNKASATPTLQDKTITPSVSTQTVTADSGYDGLDAVTVNGDANLISENIISGVSIFGVEGSAEAGGGNTTVSVTVNSVPCYAFDSSGTPIVFDSGTYQVVGGIVYCPSSTVIVSGDYIQNNTLYMFRASGGSIKFDSGSDGGDVPAPK